MELLVLYCIILNVQLKYIQQIDCTVPTYVIYIVHSTNALHNFRDSIDIAEKVSFYPSLTAGEIV